MSKVKDYNLVIGTDEKITFPNNEIYEDSTGNLIVTGYDPSPGTSGTSGTSGSSGSSGSSGIALGQTLYFHEEIADLPGYEYLLQTPADDPENYEFVTIDNNSGPTLIERYITAEGYPGIGILPAGIWNFHIYGALGGASPSTGTTKLILSVYKYDGSLTSLFEVETGDINTQIPDADHFDVETVQPEFPFDSTARVVVEVYAETDSTSSINVGFFYEGQRFYSRVDTPLPVFAGSSGTSGTSGSSGTSGTSGTSGATGAAGTSGSSGTSGLLTDPGSIGTLTVTEKLVIPTDQPTSLVDGCIWLA